ncbi:MAG: amidohydrolase family protein, partial [Planctomycetota bacterium]|nr:amidohydrolase family protein [Planctomycetota bacterium]
ITQEVATEMGQLGIEHLRGFPLGQPIKPETLQASVSTQVKSGIFHCPTVLWYSVQGGNLKAEAASKLAGIEFLPKELRKEWSDWLADPEHNDRRSRLKSLETNMLTIVAEMDRQGANLLISASDGTYVVPGFSFHEEAQLYKKAGVSAASTLQAATRNAARFFGQEAQWGSVQVGLNADLVLLTANPLEDSDHLQEISAVFVNGEHFSKAVLDAGLERIRKRHNGEE